MMDSLKVKAKMDNLDSLMDFFRNFVQQHSFTDEQLMKLELAFEEIVVNVINYAYPNNDIQDVEVKCCSNDNERLNVTVIDDGMAYNPLEKEDPDIAASIDDRPIGGLGVYLAKQIMDEIRYSREDNQNRLVLIKY